MSSSTPNGGDCMDADAGGGVGGKGNVSFLELQHHMHSSMVQQAAAAASGMPHMGVGVGGAYSSIRNPYGNAMQAAAQHDPLGHGARQLGGYPFPGMHSAAAAAAAAAQAAQNSAYTAAGYHHLSSYPGNQCPSPPRDGN